MNEIDIALQYAKKKKRNRLNQNNIRRCNGRSKLYSNSRATNSLGIEQSVMVNFNSMNLSTFDENNSSKPYDLSCSTSIINVDEQMAENNNYHQSNGTSDYLIFNDLVQDKEKHVRSLHQDTSIDLLSFSKNLSTFIRKSNICKTRVHDLINLVQSSLPQPNSLPATYSRILELLSGNTIYLFSFLQIALIHQSRGANTISYLEKVYFQFYTEKCYWYRRSL
jgi:hypothetical protein